MASAKVATLKASHEWPIYYKKRKKKRVRERKRKRKE